MPTNVTVEYAQAHEKYINARTKDEKIAALREMISTIPKHKGTSHVQADLKAKLSKLLSQTEKKGTRSSFKIQKEGDLQVCLLGLTQTGKSTLLKALTGSKVEISNRSYTTVKPEMGVAEWEGVKMQFVEIPSTFIPQWMSIAASSDCIVLVIDSTRSIEEQKESLIGLIERFRIRTPFVYIDSRNPTGIFEKVWSSVKLIHIYTKEPGKQPEKRALVLKRGSNVKDAASHVHKDFLRFFKFAKVWGKSVKHVGEKVGLEHKLADKDILEIHA
ncbi:MAG: TGS domain-containing protein [Candidatus Aenigmarchaeota archaeon]|nr:TGS domain-containing protein [Candidatus Aenigmarchaeota archaeon]